MILADTGPLYALTMKRDALHERARAELSGLEGERRRLVVSSSTLLETQSLLLRRETPVFASTYVRSLLQRSDLINPQTDDYLAAQALLERFDDRKISLFDATLAILSRNLTVPIWTFDTDFDVLGSNVWRGG